VAWETNYFYGERIQDPIVKYRNNKEKHNAACMQIFSWVS
jgi:hypothetical protein